MDNVLLAYETNPGNAEGKTCKTLANLLDKNSSIQRYVSFSFLSVFYFERMRILPKILFSKERASSAENEFLKEQTRGQTCQALS